LANQLYVNYGSYTINWQLTPQEKNDLNTSIYNLLAANVLLDTEEKAKQIILSLKEDIAIFNALSNLNGQIDEISFNREVFDVNKEKPTNDDYYEAIYAYIKILEDVSGKLLSQIII